MEERVLKAICTMQDLPLHNSRCMVTETANNLQLSLLNLTQAMNYTQVEDFNVVTPDVSEFVEREIAGLILPADVYRHAVNERPAIKAAGYRLEGSEKMLQAARAYAPSLRLGAGYSNSYYYNYSLAAGPSNASLADQLAQNSAQSVGLSLSVPIFNRMATRTGYVRPV